mmetsp:Transcript_22451/g.54330  ORF Transcript_22451/g.54330 Transcript_22451/m.54330 type:complete len:298 (-) Transcript_22451:382-1275(-)
MRCGRGFIVTVAGGLCEALFIPRTLVVRAVHASPIASLGCVAPAGAAPKIVANIVLIQWRRGWRGGVGGIQCSRRVRRMRSRLRRDRGLHGGHQVDVTPLDIHPAERVPGAFVVVPRGTVSSQCAISHSVRDCDAAKVLGSDHWRSGLFDRSTTDGGRGGRGRGGGIAEPNPLDSCVAYRVEVAQLTWRTLHWGTVRAVYGASEQIIESQAAKIMIRRYIAPPRNRTPARPRRGTDRTALLNFPTRHIVRTIVIVVRAREGLRCLEMAELPCLVVANAAEFILGIVHSYYFLCRSHR